MSSRLLILFLLSSLLLPSLAHALAPGSGSIVDILDIPFGGKILLKSWQVCLIPAPPPIFAIPIPFIYIVVGPPNPAKLYYWFGFSKKFRRLALDFDAWVLGMYMPGIDELTRFCMNKAFLPEADGVIRTVGTSCPGNQYDQCEK